MSLTKSAQELEAKGFDYSRLDIGVAQAARAAADRFRAQYRRAAAEAIEVGSALLAVKDNLDHGLFGEWLAAEFGGDARTAQNYMALAREFGAKPEIVSDLPLTIAYKLASPGVPESVREQVEVRIRDDGKLNADQVRKMIADGIEADRERRAKEREAERRSKLSEQQIKDEDRKDKARRRSREARAEEGRRREEEWQRERDRRALAQARMAAMIEENIGAEREAFVAELKFAPDNALSIAFKVPSEQSGSDKHAASVVADERAARDPAQVAVERLKSSWKTADQEARQQFVVWVQSGGNS
ncbi:DUF3102 domain-containing protein [Aureimonas sp. AU20]|uniref:DUF3102 domain-containing protein n=1 Tax=Aureimonas sp. AU20 TaxID=1349819 RepID=UPI000720AA07|nr:DUF3102 domain-containing protein [Aureimonas sp. AU20]ALN75815.1 hypothetical protein M673_23985 [Aureimonas sp. AU20]